MIDYFTRFESSSHRIFLFTYQIQEHAKAIGQARKTRTITQMIEKKKLFFAMVSILVKQVVKQVQGKSKDYYEVTAGMGVLG